MKFSIKKLLIIFLSFTLLLFYSFTLSVAQDCGSDLDCQIAQIQREIDALSPAQETNKKELAGLNTQLSDIKRRINNVSAQLTVLAKKISSREEDLAYAEEIFKRKTVDHYKFLRTYDPLLPFLSSSDASEAFREIEFKERATKKNQETMAQYVENILQLGSDKDSLEKNKASLASAQKNIDTKATFLQGEVDKTEKYLSSLSAKQQELIAAKSGGFSTSVGETPPTLEPCSGPPGSANFCDPGFRPAFAAFSFGAPHRTGLSQYGALGRSKTGQSAETILAAYFQGAQLRKDYPVPSTIGVTGHGRVPFEDNYLLGIYEVPENWGNEGGYEALKAQAIAARSYALYATNNGAGTICTTEACQVYKPQLKTGRWAEAVRATRGWVMVRGSSPAATYYASTSGGFTISQWGWSGIKDTNGDWPNQAFEKIAGSPWFYKGWYRSRAGSSCGRGNPWLTGEEMADMLNSWRVLYKGGGDVSRISPLDTNCWKGNPYSKAELVSIGGYLSVSSAAIIYNNNGSTLNITFSTNNGAITISGEEFKKAFNLRALGYIGIKSSLFNIEKL